VQWVQGKQRRAHQRDGPLAGQLSERRHDAEIVSALRPTRARARLGQSEHDSVHQPETQPGQKFTRAADRRTWRQGRLTIFKLANSSTHGEVAPTLYHRRIPPSRVKRSAHAEWGIGPRRMEGRGADSAEPARPTPVGDPARTRLSVIPPAVSVGRQPRCAPQDLQYRPSPREQMNISRRC
jgi:hypothetical protein